MLRTRIILVLALSLAVGEVFAESVSDATYHLIMGRLLADEGKGREASESFVAAIELAPSDPFIRIEYARFLLRQRRLRMAAQQVTTAYQLAPTEPDVLKVFAEIQLKMVGQDAAALDEARRALEELRQLNPSDIESMVSLGQIYLSDQKPDEAATVFQEVLDRTSGNRMVYRLLVDALTRSGQNARAIDVLSEALDNDPTFTRARLILSELLDQQGDLEGAIAVLKETPEDLQGDPEIQRRLALDLHRSGDFEGSLQAIDKVLEQDPSDYAALYLKTVVLSVEGRTDEAVTLARRLAALHPDSLDVVLLLAQLLDRRGEWREADNELERIERQLRLNRETDLASQALAQRVVILVRAEQWESVVSALEPHLPELEDNQQIDLIFLYAEAQSHLNEGGKALAILSRFEDGSAAQRAALAKQAEILYRMNDPSAAQERIDSLLSTETFEDMVKAAEVYQRLERYSEAIPILEKAIDLDPSSTQVRFWLGASYERAGRGKEAEGVLRDLLQLDPKFAPALNYLGYMWAERGEHLAEAAAMVDRAVAMEPDNGAYVDSLGWAQFQMGNHAEAAKLLERAARLLPDDAVIFEHLGDVYSRSGESQRARDAYRRALDLGGDNGEAVREKLERLSAGD